MEKGNLILIEEELGIYSKEGIKQWKEMLRYYLPLNTIIYNYSPNLEYAKGPSAPSLKKNLK